MREARIADRVAKSFLSGNIVMAYDRKMADVTRLIRALLKQLDRNRAQMMNGGYEDTTYLSKLIDVENGLDDIMRKLG